MIVDEMPHQWRFNKEQVLATLHSLFCLRDDRPEDRRFHVTGFIVSGCDVSGFGDANQRRRGHVAAATIVGTARHAKGQGLKDARRGNFRAH